MTSSTTSNSRGEGGSPGVARAEGGSQGSNFSFSSLPSETVRDILAVVLDLQPYAPPRNYLVDKRFYRLASSVKSETFRPPGHGGKDSLARILRHPRFYHPDFASPIRHFNFSIRDDSTISLPFELPLISRLTNIVSFSLDHDTDARIPADFIPALQQLPHLTTLSVSRHGYDWDDPSELSLQVKRDLPGLRSLTWSAPCPPDLLTGSPQLRHLRIIFPAAERQPVVPYGDFPWSTLRHLELEADGAMFPDLDPFLDALEAAVAQASEASAQRHDLVLDKLELRAQLMGCTLGGVQLRVTDAHYKRLLVALGSTSISHLRLPIGKRGKFIRKVPLLPSISSLALDFHCYISTVSYDTILAAAASCFQADSLEINGLLPYEDSVSSPLDGYLQSARALHRRFPFLAAFLSYLRNLSDVSKLVLRFPTHSLYRSYHWTRADGEVEFECDGWTSYHAD